jgi:hypothetical protein
MSAIQTPTHRLTTRASITATSFVNDYHWATFGAIQAG